MALRFPNPGSDIGRFISTFQTVRRAAVRDHVSEFGLDYISAALVAAGQASSSGSVGPAALALSTRSDRSRDPLFNQSKMYSELWRMLGLVRPTHSRSTFRLTLLGEALDHDDVFHATPTRALVGECLLGITLPSPTTVNVGVHNQRPFAWLLRLMARTGGTLTRHEMIVGLLAVTDDRAGPTIDDTAGRIAALRGRRHTHLIAEVDALAAADRVTRTTLENYTRFPVGVMKSPLVGWGTAATESGLYVDRRRQPLFRLTPSGSDLAGLLDGATDVRESDLEGFDDHARAAFATYAFYCMQQRAGFDLTECAAEIDASRAQAAPILSALGNPHQDRLIYSPEQQAPDAILALATSASS